MVVAGNNPEIPLLGWITVRFTINSGSASHEFRVVKNLPVAMLIGGEFLSQDECQSIYKASGHDAFGIMDFFSMGTYATRENEDGARPPTAAYAETDSC